MATFGDAGFGDATFGEDVVVLPSSVLDLSTVWLNSQLDPSDFISFPFMASLSVESAVQGEVRSYGGSRTTTLTRPARLRSVQVGGLRRSVKLSLRALTREQVAWLETHIGQVVLVRDDRGRRLWATYWAAPIDEHQYNDEAESSLDLSEVTVNEVV